MDSTNKHDIISKSMKKIPVFILHILKKPFTKFSSFSRKKKIVTIIALIIILFIGLQVISTGTNKNGYTTVKAQKSDIVEIISETGSISTSIKTDVYSPTKGIVTSLNVKNGMIVSDGTELFTVESTATEQETQAAYANYLAAKVALDDAQAGAFTLHSAMMTAWDTYYQLATGDHYENSDGTPRNDQRALPEFHIAKDDWLAAEKQYAQQQTAVSQAQAAVTSTSLLYQATQNATVKAPISGTIANISVASGSAVTIASAALATTPVLTIASSAVTEVKVPLSETDIAKVAPNQEVTIDVSAVDNHIYKGIVRRVDTIGTEIAGVFRYNAYIEITDSDDQLRPGMSADVDIITKKVIGVLAVPNAVVKPYQSGRAVRVIDPQSKKVTYIPVVIGVKGEDKTQIISGISEGQEVISSISNEGIKRPSLFGN